MADVLLALILSLAVPQATSGEDKGLTNLDVDRCVEIALEQSAEVQRAESKVALYQARLREVEATFYPKLRGQAFIAPMFTVEGTYERFDRRYGSFEDWGPYAHLEALLAQPLYTFGRAEAGERATEAQIRVEKARVREAENVVSKEVRRLYYSRLYTLSMKPAIAQAEGVLEKAIARAEELYDQATGEVSFADLSRLRFARLEIKKLNAIIAYYETVSLSALKHTMGLPHDTLVTFADERLPPVPDKKLDTEENLIAAAFEHRPEVKQIAYGRAAVSAGITFEKRASLPVLLLAGRAEATWTPTRQDQTNPYLNDPYNQLVGGLALALLFDVDPARDFARADAVAARGLEIDALERFAETGIPLQVRDARADLLRQQRGAELAQDGIKLTRKWLTFAASGYETGASSARDLLEGLAAYLESKRSYYSSLQSYFHADAALRYAVGDH